MKDDHSFYMTKSFNIFLWFLLLTIVSPAQIIKLETGADRLIKEYSSTLKIKESELLQTQQEYHQTGHLSTANSWKAALR